MKRRAILKTLPTLTLLPAALKLNIVEADEHKAAPKAAAAGSKKTKVPDFAGHMLESDMQGLGPDGKPTGQEATGASKANVLAEQAMKHRMKLTKEEEAILNGSEGEEKAKLMKVLVQFGNTFGADELVDLGGAPHSNMFIGASYMSSMINMLDECANAGLKSYATYTVNPRPYDVYNVQNNLKDMELIYEGYPLQKELDYVHAPPWGAGPELQNLRLLFERSR